MEAKSMLTKSLWCLLFLLPIAVCPAVTGKIIYVDDDGPADFNTIQAAIDDANDGDTVVVSPGTYTGEGNRDIDFKGKAITVKSEDGPQTCIIDCQGMKEEQHRGFYFHSSEDSNSVIQGFTIINGFTEAYGGGIKCDDSGPTITNCILTNNESSAYGGAICCYGSGPTISNCAFIENTTRWEGGGIWGPANIIDCTFTGNTAITGGAIFGATYIINCTIISNSANYGGVVSESENISNCIISTNSGGGIHNTGNIINCKITGNSGGTIRYSGGNIRNCTISGNFVDEMGGVICGYSNITISNCIIWDNEATKGSEICYAGTQQLIISHCDIEGGYSGIYVHDFDTLGWLEGNFDADPCFVDPGYWADANNPYITVEPNNPNAIWIEGDYHLLLTSPCINAGDPFYSSSDGETDVDGEPRFINGRIDIGIDEVDCKGSVIGVWPRQFRFSAVEGCSNPESRVLSICNTGVGMVNWSIRYDCNWLHLYPDNGDSIGEVNEVLLGVDISGLPAGYYNCELTIYDPNAFNSPQTAFAHLSVGKIVHVPDEFSTIQGAIDASDNSDVILVAPGTYTGDGNRNIDFKGKTITVRSEDGPKTCIIDCNSLYHEWHKGFFFHSSEDSNSVLSGFTITNARGGGIVCELRSSPTIINCRIGASDPCTVGYSRVNGPGVVCSYYSNPIIIGCSIVGNTTWDGAGIVCHNSKPDIINCLIGSNTACGTPKIIIFPGAGGGIFCNQSNPTITNSIIINNRADFGGGIYCLDSNPTIKNCLITGNGDLAQRGDGRNFGEGGGAVCCDSSSPIITNCTLSGNVHYGKGGTIYSFNCSNPIIDNCILWDGEDEISNDEDSTVIITYSNVQGGWPGDGNINIDPMFVKPGHWDPNGTSENTNDDFWVDGDYHLKSQAGRWDPVSESWIQDDVTSPCIDAGDPNVPVGDEPEPNGGRINMGAYGGTPQASKSISTINGRF
jgi:hypothetical protein